MSRSVSPRGVPPTAADRPVDRAPALDEASSGASQTAGASANPEPTLRHIIGRIDRTLRTRLNVRLGGHDLTTPGYTMLFVLRRLPGLSNAELARRAGQTPQATILTLQVLVDRGLVERHRSAKHHRVLDNYLTPAGEAVIDLCETEASEIEAAMLRDFGGYEREQIERLLHRCAENLGIET